MVPAVRSGIELVTRPIAMNLFSGASDVAVDLGTVNTCIYAQGAIRLNEPSIVAFNIARGDIEAIGAEARDMWDGHREYRSGPTDESWRHRQFRCGRENAHALRA